MYQNSTMYKHLFGPVPSRRLGMSLGVDLVPSKVCTLNCVYCECGKTTNLTLERKEYVPYDEVVAELKDFFQKHHEPDYLTFSGAGEPTLNSRFGDILSFVKQLKPNIPIAVLTNGTLLHIPEVRQEMLLSDLVLPSLDAVENIAFKKIDRPKKSIDIQKYIQGLVDFRKEYKGQIHLEIVLLPGYNDSQENLEQLKKAIMLIRPDKVQLNTLDRPGTVSGLMPMSRQQMQQIMSDWGLENVEIITKISQNEPVFAYRENKVEVIEELISRRPCTANDLQKILGLSINEINKYLDVLQHENKIISRFGERGLFYSYNKTP